jgi:hypothetical protein
VEGSPDCLDVQDARARGESLSGPLAAHAETCPVCSLRFSATSEGGAASSFAELERVLVREQEVLGRLRSLSTPSRLLVAAAVVASVLAFEGFFRSRTRIAPMPVARVVLAVSLFSVLLAVAARLVLRPLQTNAPPRGAYRTALGAALVLPALFAVSSHGVAGSPAGNAFSCFFFGGALGAAFVVLLRALDRGELRSGRSGLLAAAAGGLAANAALELHCPSTNPVHLILGHATIGVALLTVDAVRRARAS